MDDACIAEAMMVPTVKIKKSINHKKCNDLRVWKIELKSGRAVRLHHWIKGDPDDYQHKHPWSFITIVLWGGYTDRGEGRPDDVVCGPGIRFRDKDWRHTVVDVRPHTWSIVLTGLKLESWRFWICDRQVDQSEWDARICD